MNKTWLFTTLTLALVAAAPAHAISAKYREQLERSGCTQMTDGTTCDIHKTKAENAAAAQQASSGFGPWVGTWYVYTEYGDKIDEIVVTAKTVKPMVIWSRRRKPAGQTDFPGEKFSLYPQRRL